MSLANISDINTSGHPKHVKKALEVGAEIGSKKETESDIG